MPEWFSLGPKIMVTMLVDDETGPTLRQRADVAPRLTWSGSHMAWSIRIPRQRRSTRTGIVFADSTIGMLRCKMIVVLIVL